MIQLRILKLNEFEAEKYILSKIGSNEVLMLLKKQKQFG